MRNDTEFTLHLNPNFDQQVIDYLLTLDYKALTEANVSTAKLPNDTDVCIMMYGTNDR